MKQLNMFKKSHRAYGGELLKTRKGRSTGRPLDTKNSMHLVLRSSKAKNEWSFKTPGNRKKITAIVNKFSAKYGVKILSLANVGNHLHFHIRLSNRFGYHPFIRAVTAAIVMAVTGASRWRKGPKKFWDHRPFTRVVFGQRGFLAMNDYIQINQLEGLGVDRCQARVLIERRRTTAAPS
jgi:REP element-mobilizing transposase RayT